MVAKEKLIELFHIDSAGTSGHHAGERADARMIKTAAHRGIDVTSISRQFVSEDFKRFDYIIVMDDSNYQNVISLDPQGEYGHKVSKMTDYSSGKFASYDKVPDPYWGGEDGFDLVLDLLTDASEGLLANLK